MSGRGVARRFVGFGLVLALPTLLGAACPRKPNDCEHDSIERCNWEQAVGAAESADDSELSDDEGGVGESGERERERERDDLDDTVIGMIEVMGAGLEWSLVDARARELCRVRDDNGELVRAAVELIAREDAAEGADEGATAAEVEAWRCRLDWLEINGQTLELEASDGVISLSAIELDEPVSEAVASFARARFDDRCVTRFEIYEGAKLDEFYRCALSEGPYLVIARFPSDPEVSSWQVSIAVVDAG